MSSVLAVALLCAAATQALPTISHRQSITTLNAVQIGAFTPYSYYAGAGYCPPSQTLAWNCGINCDAHPDFKSVASGGNGDSVQYWYVGFDPSLDTVIVVHQGTNDSKIIPLLTDADIFLAGLNPTLFPGISSDIECHSGFADEHAKTATDVLAAVQQAMSEHNSTSVTLVGHSLGAAISLLDSVYLPLRLPSGTTFRTFGYGLPRVGNQAFADYVDANLHLTHINNREDPVPVVPWTFMGYVHPAGEIHIQDAGNWVVCPGQDNPSSQCSVGDVPNAFVGNLTDHDGPYNGVMMSC